MKRLLPVYIILFTFCFSTSRAQFVTIPDANFVTWLTANYPLCMNGNQMDTTCSDIVNETQFVCIGEAISDLTGVSYFDNINYLNCNFNNLTSLPPLPSSIEDIDCSGNPLITFPSLPPNLQSLWCYDCALTSLPSLPASLVQLDVPDNQLTSLPSLPAALTDLYCPTNQLTSLPALPQGLLTLYCAYNQLTTLPPIPSTLNALDCSGNLLTSLPPISHEINELNISSNPNLLCLNYIYAVGDFDWTSTGVTCLPNNIIITNSALPLLDSFPICDVMNQNNCAVVWNIKGYAYRDDNSDCIMDSVEAAYPNVKVDLYQNGILINQTFTGQHGSYSFGADTGNYDVVIDSTGLPYIVNCPPSGANNVDVTSADLYRDSIDFSLECKTGFDVGVKSIVRSSGIFRPGNSAFIKVLAGDMSNYFNLICASGISGNVTIVINGPATYLGPSSGSLIPNVNGDTLTYSVADFGLINFSTDFRFEVEIDTAAQIGQEICFIVEVTPVAGDNEPANNIYSHCFSIVNSYDPNDKQVSPVGTVDTTQEWLTYTVRFQNTGNAPAQHIYILDTLDANIDESSIQLLAYSHEPMVQVTGDVVRFNFPNINLPDSVNDEPNSHGYVQYKVKLNEGLPLGTEITNTAYIYFDFNPPVQTNTVLNTIDVITSLSDIASSSTLHIYPNPVKSGGVLNLVSKEKINGRLSLIDITGRVIYSSQTVQLPGSIVLPSLTSGIYQIMVETDNGNLNSRIVVH